MSIALAERPLIDVSRYELINEPDNNQVSLEELTGAVKERRILSAYEPFFELTHKGRPNHTWKNTFNTLEQLADLQRIDHYTGETETVGPNRFITTLMSKEAHDRGLTRDFTIQGIDHALQTADLTGQYISVNFSPTLAADRSTHFELYKRRRELHKLQFEFLETSGLDEDVAGELLTDLRKWGAWLAVDDFKSDTDDTSYAMHNAQVLHKITGIDTLKFAASLILDKRAEKVTIDHPDVIDDPEVFNQTMCAALQEASPYEPRIIVFEGLQHGGHVQHVQQLGASDPNIDFHGQSRQFNPIAEDVRVRQADAVYYYSSPAKTLTNL